MSTQGDRGVSHSAAEDIPPQAHMGDQLASDLAALQHDVEGRLARLEEAVSSGVSQAGAP